jgi:N-acyl-D-amino-acid deacylase
MRLLLALLLVTACSAPVQRPDANDTTRATSYDFDLILRGGDIIDGSGSPRRRADVGVRGDAIVTIGDLHGKTAREVLDATGQVVTPGFIDLLGNSQSAVLIDPKLEGKIRQGVTTEVTGEGHSPGPIDEAMRAEMERTKPAGWPPVTWTSLADFMRVIEQRGSALNFAFYVGAGNAREIVLGHADPGARSASQVRSSTRRDDLQPPRSSRPWRAPVGPTGHICATRAPASRPRSTKR